MGREGRDRRWERENKKMITKQNEPKRNRTQKKRESNKGEMGGGRGEGWPRTPALAVQETRVVWRRRGLPLGSTMCSR